MARIQNTHCMLKIGLELNYMYIVDAELASGFTILLFIDMDSPFLCSMFFPFYFSVLLVFQIFCKVNTLTSSSKLCVCPHCGVSPSNVNIKDKSLLVYVFIYFTPCFVFVITQGTN